ncbi:hypothetical protein AT945_06580 [Campylobacter jejuni]|nr:hypothetical protein [Campylobacter jejuni]
MARILAFDIGISSIGWAFSENDELKDCGVRIFTKAENPKTGESLALDALQEVLENALLDAKQG